ncbi:MAG: ATP-binding protein [Bacillota bacterium]
MSFDQIYGHKKNIQLFKKKLKNNSISHSYIFEGKEGIGKKLFAINLIKAILCKNNIENPCEECISCQKINHLNHPDIKIIKPDGNSIKNKQIKDFQNFLRFKPNESEYKFILIDDSEKLTKSAQNTILKVLEEPPDYAKILFITKNVNILLDTIISRGQVINFKPLNDKEISKYINENYKISTEKQNMIKIFSNGIVKNVQKAIDSKDFINLRNETIEYCNQLLYNQIINSIKGINFLKENKEQIDLIFEIMILWFRDLMIYKVNNNKDLIINKDKLDIIEKEVYKLADKNLIKIIENIQKAKQNLEKNINFKLVIDYLILNTIDPGGK